MHRRRRVSVQSSKEQLGCSLAHGLRILSSDGDRRLDDIGERNVVEADQRDPAFEPGASQRSYAADREEVLAREECRRRVGEGEQLVDGARGGLGISETGSDERVVLVDTGSVECLSVPPETLLGRRDRREIAEEADAAMAVGEE